VTITSCAQDQIYPNEADITGTLYNDHPSTADYFIEVEVLQNGQSVGTATSSSIASDTNNVPPFGHGIWFANLKPMPPGPVTCKLKKVERTNDAFLSPSGHLTHPTSDVSLSDCTNDPTGTSGPSVTVNVYNNHFSTGTYVVNVAFTQGGKTFDTVTADETELSDIEAYDHATSGARSYQTVPSGAPITCSLAGVYRWG
jgi:hypothetical protein